MIVIVVIITNNMFVLKPKFEDAKTVGINRNITKGLTMPPVRKINVPNCKMSIIRNINADLSES